MFKRFGLGSSKPSGSAGSSEETSLPAGWTAHVTSPEAGSVAYYYNTKTGETSWKKPATSKMPKAAPVTSQPHVEG